MKATAAGLAALLCSLACSQTRTPAEATDFMSDDGIRQILGERVDAIAGPEDGVGIVVGVISPLGRRVVSYGHRDRNDSRPLTGHTGFEIGSVTKVFTALLLADMVRKGEVALADPVAKYLPAGTVIPERNGRAITLLDLATHTSGLPFMPDTPLPSSASGPQFYEFLAGYRLSRDSGAEWDYSNLGYWLLSEALASRGGSGYEHLLRARVIDPLGLTGTAGTPSPAMEADVARGHDASLQVSRSFQEMPIYRDMPAAGGLVSTADDLLRLLGAAIGYEPSPLVPAIATMLEVRRPMSQSGEAQALGWVVIGAGTDQLIVHDGGTLGYASSVAWDPVKRVGVVVLSNHVASVDDIARHLLRPGTPLRPPEKRRTEIAVDPVVLNGYAGRYEAQGEGVFVIARHADFLTIQPPDDWGLPKLRLRPEGPLDFFVAELPMRVTFQAGANGRVTGILVYPPRGQKAVPAARVRPGRRPQYRRSKAERRQRDIVLKHLVYLDARGRQVTPQEDSC